MKFSFVNIPSKVGVNGAVSCWSDATSRAPVAAFVEIFTSSQKNTLLRLANRDGYGQYGIRQCPNPIFWKKSRWEKVFGKVTKIHGPNTGKKAKLFPGFNAARYENLVVLRTRKTGREIAVVCTHWAANAPLKVDKKWRTQKIAESKAHLRATVRAQTALGRDVYVMGDFNLNGEFTMPANFVWVASNKIDKIGVGVGVGRYYLDGDYRYFPTRTDHRHGGVLAKIKTRRRVVR